MKEKSPDVKGWKASIRLPKVKRYALGIILLFLIPNIYGLIKVSNFDHHDLLKENKSIRVAVVQPNIDPWNKWAKKSVDDQIKLHQHLFDSLTAAVGHIDLAIWSETAIGYINESFNTYHKMYPLQHNINKNETSLLTGFVDYHYYKDDDEIPPTARYLLGKPGPRFDAFNSALLVNPKKYDRGAVPQLHHKSRLTPFAERLPYADYFMFAKEWFEWGVGISGWQKGYEQQPLTIRRAEDSVLIGSVICIESIYSDCVSEFVRNGAEFLTVITNDAWYDYTTGPEQHYYIAAIRAIESGRYIARCANSGVSGFISPTGQTISSLPQYKRAAAAEFIPLLTHKTMYVIWGDVLPIFSAILIILAFVFSKRLAKKKDS